MLIAFKLEIINMASKKDNLFLGGNKMTLEEALQMANDGDVEAMEALSDYYADVEDNPGESLKWSVEAAKHGSIKMCRYAFYMFNTMGKLKKTEENFKAALEYYSEATAVALKCMENHMASEIWMDSLNNSLYNQAYCTAKAEDDYDRASSILSFGDRECHLKTKTCHIFLGWSTITLDEIQQIYNILMNITIEDLKRNDLAEDSFKQQCYAFDEEDEYMLTVAYVKCANALRDESKMLFEAKKVLEHGASVLTRQELSEILKDESSKYKTNLFGKMIYQE